MNKRERVLTALSGGVSNKVPKEIILCPKQMEVFREKTGAIDPRLDLVESMTAVLFSPEI